jgi:cardiolipin synthase
MYSGMRAGRCLAHVTSILIVLGAGAALILAILVFLMFFERGLGYRVEPGGPPLDSDPFLHVMAGLADAQIHRGSRIDVIAEGHAFYDAQLAAIRAARSSVHLEQYIFCEGVIGSRFVEALTARARAGVKVRVTVDYAGSFSTHDAFFDPLRAAGGEVRWYQPPRWYTFKHLSNRTHRKILVVDGTTGFLGGAGIADEWLDGTGGAPPWRDTMFRVDGGLATGLQTCFLENWIESSGAILVDPVYFPVAAESTDPDATGGFVVISAPQAGRSTRAHVAYKVLIAQAARTIDIVTPYFLPDEATQAAIVRARGRGVRVRLLTAGAKTDQRLTRASGRDRYGELLRAGGEVFEYQPAMLHAKALIVDATWCVIGSTNLDNRSFALNDEVVVVARDAGLAATLTRDMERDLTKSTKTTYEAWKKRPLVEKITGRMARVLDRQS